jgi:hypothetical protein
MHLKTLDCYINFDMSTFPKQLNQQQLSFPETNEKDALLAWVQHHGLGKYLLCTMKDGRQAYGILTCIDRLYVYLFIYLFIF